MSFFMRNRVKETTTTTGTGTLNLAGAGSGGFRTFANAVGNGNSCPYIIDDNAGNYEIGIGTVTSGSPDTLSRDTVIANSLGTTAKINFGSGTKDVFLSLAAEFLPQSPTELTIATGAVTLTQAVHTIDTEADAASDDLDTLTVGAMNEGQVVTLLAANSARKVYLTTAGNIGVPCLLSTTLPTRLMLVGSTWYPLQDGPVLLESTTVSGTPAAIELTKASWFGGAFRALEIRAYELALTNDADGIDLFFRAAAAYLTSSYAGAGFTHVSGSALAAITPTTGRALLTNATTQGNAAGEAYTGRILVTNAGLAGVQKKALFESVYASPIGVQVTERGHYTHSGTAALDGLKLQVVTSASNTFASGVVELWGYR